MEEKGWRIPESVRVRMGRHQKSVKEVDSALADREWYHIFTSLWNLYSGQSQVTHPITVRRRRSARLWVDSR